jgi:hypothetical protein
VNVIAQNKSARMLNLNENELSLYRIMVVTHYKAF